MRIFLLALFVIFCGCSIDKKKEAGTSAGVKEDTLSGEQLSKTYCSSCHLYTPPELLDKKSWKDGVLPQMGYRLGIYGEIRRDSLIEKGIAAKIINAAGIFPTKQVITNKKWEKIRQFYLKNAPDSLLIPDEKISKNETKGFKIVAPDIPQKRPLTTVVKYDANSKCYYVGSSKIESSSVSILNSSAEPLVELGLPFPISDITVKSDTLLILMMGHFIPSDEPAGMLVKAFKGPGDSGYKGGGFSVVLNKLQRPVDVAYSDVDQDGSEDIVVCEYGNHTGSLSLFLKRGQQYEKKILNRSPGAIKVAIRDLNGDALQDIIALMAQGDEGIDIYYNQGNAQFKQERVLRFPPSYGSVSCSLADFNNDGHLDILYANGDNADYSPVFKPYHGVRIFLNDGANHFEEAYFYQQNGSYDAIASDFDNDGDLDIASISFFPDFFQEPDEGFIYLENRTSDGNFNFSPSVLAGSENGRWITIDAADVDSDGDDDLLLGSYTGMAIQNDTTSVLMDNLVKSSKAFLILENTFGKR